MDGKRTSKVCVALTMLLILPVAAAQRPAIPLIGITVRNATVEERFLRKRTEQEPVATNILGSDVRGEQTTTTETRIRIFPDADSIRFDVVSVGDVRSETSGMNSQALIESVGRHHFEITKPFWFNGKSFLTKPGYGTIRASQAPQRVLSVAGAKMPLLRPLSDRVAWEQVTRRQAEINQAVAEDVSRTVLPKVDRLVDEEFAALKRKLASLREQIELNAGTTPVNWVAKSSEKSFSVAAVPQSRGEEGRGIFDSMPVKLPELESGEEVAFTLSEGVATALLERYVPGGLVLTDTQVEKASKVWNRAGDEKWSLASLMQLFQEVERNSSAEPAAFSIQLAQVQPIAIRFDRGDVCIETSFQILPKGAAPSGWMKTTWRLRGRGVSDDQWAVALRQVEVGDAEDSIPVADVQESEPNPVSPELRIPSDTTFEPTNGKEPVEHAPDSATEEDEVTAVESGTVWMSVVKSATQSLLEQVPAATLPKEFDVPLPGSSRIRLLRIESADGVLRAAFRLVDCAPPPKP